MADGMNTPASNTVNSINLPIDGDEITSRIWSVDEAFRYCERLTRSHYENFPVGSVLIPKRLRKHFCAIYAFARTADDFADEKYGEGIQESWRLECISRWRSMLRRAFEGEAQHPIFIALAKTADSFSLPINLFEDLLSAFAQDVTKRRYDDFPELTDYCQRSANPVGRLILLLFGYTDEEYHLRSDDICTALQLANHWQDVSVDLGKDRIYLPLEDIRRCGLSVEELKNKRMTESFRELMRFEVSRAWDFFNSGRPLCGWVKGRLGLELRAVWFGGTRILERIERNGYDVYGHRPVITRMDKLKILTGSLRKSAFKIK